MCATHQPSSVKPAKKEAVYEALYGTKNAHACTKTLSEQRVTIVLNKTVAHPQHLSGENVEQMCEVFYLPSTTVERGCNA
jgi:hypothetical protein